jgi:hypothetical protein
MGCELMACEATRISLHVRVPGAPDASGSNVRLVIKDEPVCGGGELFFGRPDPAGALRIHTPACGEARLVVAKAGRRTVVQKLDTCDVESLEVVLWPAPPARSATGACGAVVNDFVAAWVDARHEQARSFWAASGGYERHARKTSDEKPWAIDIAPSELAGDRCRVLVTERYDIGCDFAWQLELEQEHEPGGGTWRVRSMDYVPPSDP